MNSHVQSASHLPATDVWVSGREEALDQRELIRVYNVGARPQPGICAFENQNGR